jgi:hypothetical protein
MCRGRPGIAAMVKVEVRQVRMASPHFRAPEKLDRLGGLSPWMRRDTVSTRVTPIPSCVAVVGILIGRRSGGIIAPLTSLHAVVRRRRGRGLAERASTRRPMSAASALRRPA